MCVCVTVCLHVADCSRVTSQGLGHLNSLTWLSLAGIPDGVLTDVVFDCSEMWILQLGRRDGPAETNVKAAAVIRSVRLRTLTRAVIMSGARSEVFRALSKESENERPTLAHTGQIMTLF